MGRNIHFGQNKDQFDKSATLIPLNQVGLLLNKKESTGPIDETHLKYLRNEKEQAWIPYSYVESWTRNGFVLSAQMSRTSTSTTEKPMVNFEFVNDEKLGNVSNEDMQTFLARISDNTNKRQVVKKNLKNSILKAQNGYLSAKDLYDKTKKDNKILKQKIADLEAELKKVITKITNIDSVISKLNQDVAVKRGLKSDAEGTLNTKTNALEQRRDQYLIEMSFPKNQPKAFKAEFAISQNDQKTVEESYEICNNKAENADKCLKKTAGISFLRRRLR